MSFIEAKNMDTLEEYGTMLLMSMISIRTLESFHIEAFKQGILDTDEEECSKTICWELRRLMALYTKQVEFVFKRANLDQKEVFKSLSKMVKPKRKKNGKSKTDG